MATMREPPRFAFGKMSGRASPNSSPADPMSRATSAGVMPGFIRPMRVKHQQLKSFGRIVSGIQNSARFG